jgi:hypothetical protein
MDKGPIAQPAPRIRGMQNRIPALLPPVRSKG